MSVSAKVESDERNKHIVVSIIPELEGRPIYFVFEELDSVQGSDKKILRLKGENNPPKEVYEHLWLEGFYTV